MIQALHQIDMVKNRGDDADGLDEAKWSLRPPEDVRRLMWLALRVPGTDRSKLIWHCLRIALPRLAEAGRLIPHYEEMRKAVQASEAERKLVKAGRHGSKSQKSHPSQPSNVPQTE